MTKGLWQSVLPVVVVTLILHAGSNGWNASSVDRAEDETGIHSITMIFESSPTEFRFERIGAYDLVVAEELNHFTRPGEPMLPMKTSTMKFEKNVDILGVVVASEKRIAIEGTFHIAPTPEPLTWGLDKIGEWSEDPEVYGLKTHFPGESFSFRTGEDEYGTNLYVYHYPVQYVPGSGEIEIIAQLVLEIKYSINPANEPLADDPTAECVIITPSSLYLEAKQLADFHEGTLGVPTSVVNTSWIAANYTEAPDPPYNGYWDSGLNGWNQIVGYDYSLAKKTVNYLRHTSAHPNLRYVLAYGNAELVPPSFYWYDSNVGGFMPYEGWIPTDFFYTSPDYDFTPNYAFGRLPVDGNARAQAMNQKIFDWHANLSPTWFENVAVAGGRPFGTGFYIGELINADALNNGYFDGFRITKMHQTDGTFDEVHVTDALKGEYGVVYAIGHGSGESFVVNDSAGPGEQIMVSEVMALPANTNVSVFASIGCGNGAFDSTVMTNEPYTSPISFGESTLFSAAAAIAYIGGSRSNQGLPTGYIDDGELFVTGETHMAHILTGYWKAFRNGEGTLGNISSAALEDFSSAQNMADLFNRRALLEYVLLGDPVLPLMHPRLDQYSTPTTQIMNVGGSEGYGDPFIAMGQIPQVPLDKPNKVRAWTDSPSVNFKIINTELDVTLEYGSNTTSNDETYYDFTPSGSAVLLLRAEGDDGKEIWQYMKPIYIPDYPKAPELMAATLNGPSDQDVALSWYKSIDEGNPLGTTKYEIFRSDSITGSYTKIGEKIATGQGSYVYIDPGKGDGDTSNYFYYVQSVNSSGESARSYYAGKYAKMLAEGWNLISLPLIQDDSRTDVVLRTLDMESVATYVPSDKDDPWKRSDTSKSWGDLEILNRTMGLWVKTATSDYLTIAGLVPKTTLIQLEPGWNLVGYPTFDEKIVFMELGFTQYVGIEEYDPASQPYCLRAMDPFDMMSTGSAYWVQLKSAQIWMVANPA